MTDELRVYRPLFSRFPLLQKNLPHVLLGDLPTPVQRLEHLEASLGANSPAIYIKRDDLSSTIYGGNKVRKLEFVLARALDRGYQEVLTFGGAGSNHALATALYAKPLDLKCISMLVPQPNAAGVQRNLLMHYQSGAELHHFSSIPATAAGSIALLIRHKLRTGRFPYLIPPGGSSPTGLIGFVNAAFELREQVDAGLLPEPDYLYAASGTMGTVVGLALGLVAAGMKTQVMAVRVTDALFTSIPKARKLFRATLKVIRQADPGFPSCDFPVDTFRFRHEFFGEEYGRFTEEGQRAVHLLLETEDVKIEGTYTGKTLAALLADTASGDLQGKKVLFWNTYNARDFSADIEDTDYHALPPAFHRYFEEATQSLDQG
jgi:1-aminocyclopropane-1-carboxylate deaminase/D-cysteine desulfhydrase-like pyridoxal-dependent ACC family enzyme